MNQNQPNPLQELDRLMELSQFDLEYSDLDKSFANLTKLAAKVAGTDVSLINLIDSFTQWSIASFGVEIKQMPRKDSICQYTIMEAESDGFEVRDLTRDSRFSNKLYVTGDAKFKYYYGVPLKTKGGFNIGALCVLDTDFKLLSPEKKEMLTFIASEIVTRLKIHQLLSELKRKVKETNNTKNKVAHDIRGPIGGIIGLAEIIEFQGYENKMDEVLEFNSLIQKSGKSLLELANEILEENSNSFSTGKGPLNDHEYNLVVLKSKLFDMYLPQAAVKNILLAVEVSELNNAVQFPRNKLLQILGNLISNSIKFTPENGSVVVFLDLEIIDQEKIIHISVRDSGVGMDQTQIDHILKGDVTSTPGTLGEIGFGFGLNLVQRLVKEMKGKLMIQSQIGKGVKIELMIPVS